MASENKSSVMVDKGLMKQVKFIAVEKDAQIQKVVEDALSQYIAQHGSGVEYLVVTPSPARKRGRPPKNKQ